MTILRVSLVLFFLLVSATFFFDAATGYVYIAGHRVHAELREDARKIENEAPRIAHVLRVNSEEPPLSRNHSILFSVSSAIGLVCALVGLWYSTRCWHDIGKRQVIAWLMLVTGASLSAGTALHPRADDAAMVLVCFTLAFLTGWLATSPAHRATEAVPSES